MLSFQNLTPPSVVTYFRNKNQKNEELAAHEPKPGFFCIEKWNAWRLRLFFCVYRQRATAVSSREI